ncbi:DUF4344 domain-containing metallopeptidase [Roseibium salinum]|uniref:DUF4344 domain-containing metallopeptidase n=1 Tax=Roseibium salinum TaxID=1604349 RepID=A0ABT3R1W0_9HYPH|nr:DUF4344 domain-containing metallopeptidase [Roseibium sp. DSM 29163]MCX2723149.1 DUF4344 domain-containing metallopeptidase [Roseibium sp. DSM 29163]
MTRTAAILARIRTAATAATAVFCLCLAAAPSLAAAQEDGGYLAKIDEDLAGLNSEELEELLVFVAGNALFTLYHEGGHMLVSELGLPVLAQEEDAVDNLATVTMLAADSDDMDLLLTNAMIGWFLIAGDDGEDVTFYDQHDLDPQRGYRMLCLMVGADERAFLDVAQELGLPEERVETCSQDYEQVSASWETATEPYLREDDPPAGKIEVRHEPAPDGLSSLALFLKESALMEDVAAELDTLYELPENVTFRATSCDEENAFWDPDMREVILCHELLGAFAGIYLDVLKDAD